MVLMLFTFLATTSLLAQFGSFAEILLVLGGVTVAIIISVGYFRSRGRDNALTIANQNVDAYKDMVDSLNQKYDVLQGKYNEMDKSYKDSLKQIEILTSKVKDLSELISGTHAIDALGAKLEKKLEDNQTELKDIISHLEVK
jgi:peptidoglycan hydrolase CwlO-like protein